MENISSLSDFTMSAYGQPIALIVFAIMIVSAIFVFILHVSGVNIFPKETEKKLQPKMVAICPFEDCKSDQIIPDPNGDGMFCKNCTRIFDTPGTK